MSDSAIRVEHLSKLYHSSARQERHDTTSTRLSAGLRDALSSVFGRQSSVLGSRWSVLSRQSPAATDNRPLTTSIRCSMVRRSSRICSLRKRQSRRTSFMVDAQMLTNRKILITGGLGAMGSVVHMV